MKIAVTSGKGGTGKTTVAVNLALSSQDELHFLDCDVEEPNSRIFLLPRINRMDYALLSVPFIDKRLCNYCGKCAQFCAFNALAVVKSKVLLFQELCRGCGGCRIVCPEKAISEIKRTLGYIRYGEVGNLHFIEGEVKTGEEMSGSIIHEMKKNQNFSPLVIIDGPPGLSPSLIETIDGVDYCIVVTEPSAAGFHDMCLTLELLKKLNISHGVIINKYREGVSCIENYCNENNLDILLKIPFDMEISVLYSRGIPFVTEKPEWKKAFRKIIQNIISREFPDKERL